MSDGGPATVPWSAQGCVHVAGVVDAAEAAMLIDCGIGFLGFPLVLDHHREDLSLREAARIVSRFSGRATFFAITYLRMADEIAALCADLGVGLVQLHGDIRPSEIGRLRSLVPSLRTIKSLIVRDGNASALSEEVAAFAPLVDAFITDTFDPETGASGATGKTHDWAVSRRLVALSPKPVILAGGLTPANVREAIRAVRPAGVDVHTGVEGADGRKCRDLVTAFLAEARAGFAAVGA